MIGTNALSHEGGRVVSFRIGMLLENNNSYIKNSTYLHNLLHNRAKNGGAYSMGYVVSGGYKQNGPKVGNPIPPTQRRVTFC